jgi:hypothetical protein
MRRALAGIHVEHDAIGSGERPGLSDHVFGLRLRVPTFIGTEARVAIQTDGRNYEFTPQQDAVFRRVAGAVSFVGAAMMVPAAVLLVVPAYLFLARGPSAPEGLFAVLGILLMVMGVNLFGAAQHFKRIATTEGRDIENLMIAMGEVARVYAVQRWLWIALGLVLIVAIVTNLTAR